MSEQRWPQRAVRPSRTVAANAYVAYRAIRGLLGEAIAVTPMDPLRAILLRAMLLSGGRVSIGVIRRQFALPASTLSTALKRLETDGLIDRYCDPLDARMRVAALTDKGTSTARLVTPAFDEIEAGAEIAVGELGRKGFNHLANILGAIYEEPDPWA